MSDNVGICRRCGKTVGKWDGYMVAKDKSWIEHCICPNENPQTGKLEGKVEG